MTAFGDPEEVRARVVSFIDAAPLPAEERARQLDYAAGNAWRYAATLRCVRAAVSRPIAKSRVLDVGAYPGHLTVMLRRAGADVLAVTLVTSPAFAASLAAEGVRLLERDVERDRLPAADGSVEVVLCSELIEHLDGEVVHLLRECRRVLAEQGCLVLTTPNHAALSRRWELLRGRTVYPPLDDPRYPFYAGAGQRNPWRHVREFTVAEVRELLCSAGFERPAVCTVSAPKPGREGLSLRGRVLATVLHLVACAVRNGGSLIVATARK